LARGAISHAASRPDDLFIARSCPGIDQNPLPPDTKLNLTILLERSVQPAMVPRSQTGERRQISQCFQIYSERRGSVGAMPQPAFSLLDAGNPSASTLRWKTGWPLRKLHPCTSNYSIGSITSTSALTVSFSGRPGRCTMGGPSFIA
jgi:hypothetical protein